MVNTHHNINEANDNIQNHTPGYTSTHTSNLPEHTNLVANQDFVDTLRQKFRTDFITGINRLRTGTIEDLARLYNSDTAFDNYERMERIYHKTVEAFNKTQDIMRRRTEENDVGFLNFVEVSYREFFNSYTNLTHQRELYLESYAKQLEESF
jgi:hypothetical protein